MRKLNMTKRLIIPISILVIVIVTISLVSILQIVKITSLSDEASLAEDRVQIILAKNIDHINWVMVLRDSIDNAADFEGQQNPELCAFGQWMYSDEIMNLEDIEVQEYISEIEPYHNALHESAIIVSSKIEDGKIEDAEAYYKETVVGLLDEITSVLTKLEIKFAKDSDLAKTSLIAAENTTKNVLIIVSAIGLFVGLLLSIIITIQIVKQLSSNIELLSQSAVMVSSASVQLASAGQQLSEGSTEQAASIEETSATMEETSSMVQQNTDSTRHANNLSKEASDAASDGSIMMKEMSKSMDELKKSSNDIAKIIKVIDDIAFQTNMLALNAAVEAARAGESGQGFAIVAEEVRNLARKSAEAASDTVNIINRNIELSDQGVVTSKKVHDFLNDILIKTHNVNSIVNEIMKASEEQSRGTIQVTEAIGQMEKVVQQNAATAEESAASAEELQKQSQTLASIVSDLGKLVKSSKVEKKEKHIRKWDAHKISNDIDNYLSKTSKYIVESNDIIHLAEEEGF